MPGGFPLAVRRKLAAMPAIGLLAAAPPALAEGMAALDPGPDLPAVAIVGAGAASGEPVRIQIGRALDFEGRPVYAGKSAFSGIASVATFSTKRPIVHRSPGNISLVSPMPLARAALTSNFGFRAHPTLGGYRLHSGVDLAAPTGSPIVATSDGVVGHAGWNGGYGLAVRLDHGGGLETRYGHMSGVAVTPGQRVSKGDIIGYVGSTGRSTGPHLHYEMRMNGVAIRPILK